MYVYFNLWTCQRQMSPATNTCHAEVLIDIATVLPITVRYSYFIVLAFYFNLNYHLKCLEFELDTFYLRTSYRHRHCLKFPLLF